MKKLIMLAVVLALGASLIFAGGNRQAGGGGRQSSGLVFGRKIFIPMILLFMRVM
jgi:hypothetical protein